MELITPASLFDRSLEMCVYHGIFSGEILGMLHNFHADCWALSNSLEKSLARVSQSVMHCKFSRELLLMLKYSDERLRMKGYRTSRPLEAC